MGISFDDIAGSIITASATMGKNEKTFTGIRNFFLHLPDAMKAGMVHKGPFLSMLKELQAASPDAMINLFGERTVAVVAALADKSGEVASNSNKIGAVAPSVLSQRATLRLQDPTIAAAETLKSAQQQSKQMDAIRFEDPKLRNAIVGLKLTETGYDMRVGAISNMLDITGLGKKLSVAIGESGDANNNDDKAVAVAQQITALRKAGDMVSRMRAGRMEIQYGKLLAMGRYSSIFDSAGSIAGQKATEGATDESNLSEFDALNASGYQLSPEDYKAYHALIARGKKQKAVMLLSRHAQTAEAQAKSAADLDKAAFYTYSTADQNYISDYRRTTEGFQFAKGFTPSLGFEEYQNARDQGDLGSMLMKKSPLTPVWGNIKSAAQNKSSLSWLQDAGEAVFSPSTAFGKIASTAFTNGGGGAEAASTDPVDRLVAAADKQSMAADKQLQAAELIIQKFSGGNDDGEGDHRPDVPAIVARGVRNPSASINR